MLWKSFCFILFIILSNHALSSLQNDDGMKQFQVSGYNKLFNMDAPKGRQILHAKSTDKVYHDSMKAYQFVAQYLTKAEALSSDAAVLKYGSNSVNNDLREGGFFIEVGIHLPRTTNALAFLNPYKTIYGIVSKLGIEEDWEKESGRIIERGTFAFEPGNIIPVTCSNIQYYMGDNYAEVLSAFKKNILKESPIAFLHLDTHTYGATKTVFDVLGKNIIPQTIIVADELYNYPNYASHEWRALKEFIDASGYAIEFLAFNDLHEQVALKTKANDNKS